MEFQIARGTFSVQLTPGASESDGAIYRFDLAKTWSGALSGKGSGVMLSGGDPAAGNAGYVAVEVFRGSLAGREGTFLLQQFGDLAEGEETLYYQVVSGSGTDALAGLSGTMGLDIDDEGVHHYNLQYHVPG